MTYDIMLLTASTVRSVIVAPPGKKLVVSDLSNIEGRGLAWLAGEEWKLQAYRDFDAGTGPDLYKLAYAKAFDIDPKDVTKFGRSVGKVMELMLGFAGGVGAFLTGALTYNIDLDDMADKAWDTIPDEIMAEAVDFVDWWARTLGTRLPLSDRACLVCESFKRMWRQAHPMTVQLWSQLADGFRNACRHPGTTFRYRDFAFRRDGAWLRIKLPSGRCLCYPQPQVSEDGKTLSYMGTHQFTRKWGRIVTHGGRLVENCIAEGTPVLTDAGWVPIQSVTGAHRVWDGGSWVQNSGCVYSGKQLVSEVFGVEMTSEHRVLTTKGWRDASSCEGYYRAPCRVPDSGPLRWEQRQEVLVGDPLRLRPDDRARPLGIQEDAEAGGDGLLRVPEGSDTVREAYDARNVEAPSVRRVAVDDRPLPPTDAPSVAQLWRAGHSRLRALAKGVREFLGGHGPDLPARPDAGTEGQYGGVFCDQLPVGEPKSAGEQHQKKSLDRDASWQDDGDAGGRNIRPEILDAAVPGGAWLASGPHVRDVWDIQDCGPRNRFTVQGADGGLLIVHNCTQSIARDFMFDALENIEAAGYDVTMRVHDEVITEAPDTDDYNAAQLSSLLATNPPWGAGMPLAAAGFESYVYKKE